MYEVLINLSPVLKELTQELMVYLNYSEHIILQTH